MARNVAVKFYSSDPTAYDGPGWYVKDLLTNVIKGPFAKREEAEALLEDYYSDYCEPLAERQRRL